MSLGPERPLSFAPGDGLNPGHLWITYGPGGPRTWEVVQDEYGVRQWYELRSPDVLGPVQVTTGGAGSFLVTLDIPGSRSSAGITLVVTAPPAATVGVSLNVGSSAGSAVIWTEPVPPGLQALALLRTGTDGHVIVNLQASGAGGGQWAAQAADGLWWSSSIVFP